MAARAFDILKALMKGGSVIAGGFRPNGAGAVDNTLNVGTKGWTVARTSAGLFTVTLDDGYPSVGAVVAMTQLNAAADGFAQGRGAFDVKTAKTFQIANMVGAVETDIASNANNWIYFIALLKNSEIS